MVSSLTTTTTRAAALAACLFGTAVQAGSTSNNRYSSSKYGLYQQSGKMTWMDGSNSLSFKILGCVWAVTEDNEDHGCLANSSEDGTQLWYQMANCRRAQVAYNVYGSSSGSTSCNSANFKESFHSTNGVVGFFSTLDSVYSNNNYVTYNDVYNLPNCVYDNGYYYDIGCDNQGGFVLAKFSDQYCMVPVSTSNSLNSLNDGIQNMGSKCLSCSDSSGAAICSTLIGYSESCSPLDNAMCGDEDGSKSYTYKQTSTGTASASASQLSSQLEGVGNTVKYALGSCFLLASFIMFLGILMMNRRKRRYNLNRKFRQSARSRSRSKSRTRSSSRTRSQSQSRSKSQDRKQTEEGVYT